MEPYYINKGRDRLGGEWIEWHLSLLKAIVAQKQKSVQLRTPAQKQSKKPSTCGRHTLTVASCTEMEKL
jgi:hypothetical protein